MLEFHIYKDDECVKHCVSVEKLEKLLKKGEVDVLKHDIQIVYEPIDEYDETPSY
tara:strand:- start:305 stop:469 length:165 start_codon:yes stop_codon:yes gene_type:complete